MKITTYFFKVMVLLALSGPVCAATANYEIVPLPQQIVMQKGGPFVLETGVEILAMAALQREAEFLKQYLKEVTSIDLPIAQKYNKKGHYIKLTISPKVKEAEGYILTVSQKGIRIEGGSAAGVFYGIQTLRKAVKEGAVLPAVIITDAPRFVWRGMHLDCSRHFFSTDFVKKFIDLLALHNMNRFHWHLTDDQGWRIEMKKWPKLIEIVAYAADRHITIIPEIDMPGHMLAALASYPELGCTGGPYQVGHYWGIYKDVLCIGNERVYQFIEDVLTEIMDLFPSEVIHIGGDEAPTDKWLQCPKCQRLGQTHFTKRVFDFLTSKGRRALGWDEILEGSPEDAMIMSWRGTEPGAKAAETGHDVVMSPTTYCYFDYQQVEEALFEPSRCGGCISIEKVYSLDPAPDSLSVTARRHILGTQANLWTEYITNEAMLEYQVLPRMSALSEVQWTQPKRKDYEAFKGRLTRLTALFELYHYQYAKHLWPDRQIPSRWLF